MSQGHFSYVIARYWPGTKNLCIYTYGSEIQNSSLSDAEALLSYVRRNSGENGSEYEIVPVKFDTEKLDD